MLGFECGAVCRRAGLFANPALKDSMVRRFKASIDAVGAVPARLYGLFT